MIGFAYPMLGWLILLPLAVFHFLPRARKMYGDALQIPFVTDIEEVKSQLKGKMQFATAQKVRAPLRLTVLIVIWGLSVAALCRPQWIGEPHKTHQQTRDIMLVVDISKSMLEPDFAYQGRYYDRLTAVKNVVSAFADERVDDRLGLVLFGTRAYMQVPLTFDKAALKETLFSVDAGMAGNSTSIGDAIGIALKYLAAEENKLQNKVIVLLTDGENNDGSLSFPQALKLAAEEKIKFYTIGVGSDTESFFGGLFSLPKDSDLDESGLQQLAQLTKGNYYRARDVDSLYKIYGEINRLEAQDKEGRYVQETKDLFYYPAALALLLFLMMFGVWGRK